MKAPDIPDNEASRLSTLQSLDVLDTAPEERFDRVTRMAKRLFQVPIALVSIVDQNRQWFKSCIGLDVSETPRDISFCGHTILGDNTFYIEDATKDERFADNPLVAGPPHIRFYAGHPLRAPSGEKMGTLCIIDSKPKKLSNDDLLALEDLAAIVDQELAAVQLATMDELTNISNRRGFNRLANNSLSFCQRQKLPATLLYFDLDAFKPINDNYGHQEGDRALLLFAEQLKGFFRESDVCARVGGDEFVVLLTNTDTLKAKNAITRFKKALSMAQQTLQLAYKLEFSYGVACCQTGQQSNIDQLIHEADQAMYQHKSAKR